MSFHASKQKACLLHMNEILRASKQDSFSISAHNELIQILHQHLLKEQDHVFSNAEKRTEEVWYIGILIVNIDLT